MGRSGKTFFMTREKDFPLLRAVEVVDHQEAPAVEIIAKTFGLGIAEAPSGQLRPRRATASCRLHRESTSMISSIERVWMRVRRRTPCTNWCSALFESVPQLAPRGAHRSIPVSEAGEGVLGLLVSVRRVDRGVLHLILVLAAALEREKRSQQATPRTTAARTFIGVSRLSRYHV